MAADETQQVAVFDDLARHAVFHYLQIFADVRLDYLFPRFKPYKGFIYSEWVGLKHFERLFTEPEFLMILKNTLVLFGLNLFIYFPIPIILASDA